MNKVQRIKNTTARIITFTPRRDHTTPILKELHWYSINGRLELKILLHVFRCLDGTAPLYLENMLKRRCSTRRTRSSQQQLLEMPQTKLDSFSFQVIGPRLWNSLPIAIKRSRTPPVFKRTVKTHMFKAEYC